MGLTLNSTSLWFGTETLNLMDWLLCQGYTSCLLSLKICGDFVTRLNLCRTGLYKPTGDFLDVR